VNGSTTRPAWVVWAGLAVVLAAAAILSFDALRGLALAVRIPDHFAWLMPIAVDAGAAVSCATWLGARTAPDAAQFAGRMTWALLAVTVVGNAGQLGMHAHGINPPWWVAVLVGTIPPAVVGATVHLLVLLLRSTRAATEDTLPAEPEQPAVVDPVVEHQPVIEDDHEIGAQPADEPVSDNLDDNGLSRLWDTAPLALVPAPVVDEAQPEEPKNDRPATPLAELIARYGVDHDRTMRLLANGAGRPTLVHELGVTPHQARQLAAAKEAAAS
jgi:hypothetical protein